MTRHQNRIGESMELLPDGDTEPPILGETQPQTNSASSITSLMGQRHHITTSKSKGT
jgi:hypothetical protein